jgi:small subunit ribosomal protein S4e
VIKPNPGGHSDEMCMPLGVILRDVLGLAHSRREAKRMVATRKVLVDGRIETDSGRGVGLMDVLTVGEDHYRCVLDENGKLRYRSITAKDSSSKLCRVMGKTTIRGGKTQVHLHDGRNITVDDAKKYNSGDTLVISLPEQEVSGHHAFSEGVLAYLTGGSHIGSTAKVVSKDVKRSSKANEVQFEDFGTVADYVFVIGSEKDLPLEVEA